MTNPIEPLGQISLARSRFGDGQTTPLLPRTQAIPVTYTIVTSQYAAVVPVTYTVQAHNTAVIRLYYLIVPPSAFAINGDGSIVAPDTVIYPPRSVANRTLNGIPQLQGYQQVVWNYSVMLVGEFQQIISHYDPQNPIVTITYPNDEGTWVQRQAVMRPPTYGTQTTSIVSNVALTFTHIFN